MNSGQGSWLDRSRKTYIGSLFEQEQQWNETGSAWDITSTRIYISTPSGIVGSWINNTSEPKAKKTIFHRDHLGSVIAESILSQAKPTSIDKEFSYDPGNLKGEFKRDRLIIFDMKVCILSFFVIDASETIKVSR